ncbi:MAG: hypothetical protein DI535_22980 [Citrobacter freundii]|nr:MAG: hypothetical protein DI535_22980 [Citrobacter freundii]
MQQRFLLYGANGYTGELIARFASDYDLIPIIAGRRKEVIEPMAKKLGLPFLVFDLQDAGALRNALKEVKLVMHCAGPYDHTAIPVIEACLETQTHYIDLNGDLDVFEKIKTYDQRAKEKNVMLLPGAGFDVVPTDCLALWLKNKLPDATHLEIAFAILGSKLSRGTSLTTVLKLGEPGATRKNGLITPEPVGKTGKTISFKTAGGQQKDLFVMSIPWGDVSTAYFSTGIPNITSYTGMSKGVWLFNKGQFMFNWLLRTSFMRNLIRGIINRQSPGPGDEIRDKATSLIWAKVQNQKGESVTGTMQTPEAYSLTASSMLLVAKKILNGEYKPGYQTPSSAYGADLVMEIKGVHRS